MHRTARLALATGLIAIASDAAALSCMRPNLGQAFNQRAEATQVYVLAHGRFVADTPLPAPPPPVADGSQSPPPVTAMARFEGRQLGRSGDGPLSIDITMVANCLGPWCGGWPPLDTELVVFLERLGDGTHRQVTGPCPGDYFANVTEAGLSRLRQCLANGACSPADIAAFEGG